VRPRAKVTIDSLQEVVYEKSIGTKINDLDLCLGQGLVNHCVTFDVEYLGPNTLSLVNRHTSPLNHTVN